MKKRILTYIAFLLMVAIALFVMLRNRKSTIRPDEMSFSLEKPWMVDKIEISRKGNVILLEKAKNKWQINHANPAKSETVEMFLRALGRISIISPASKTISDTITVKLLHEGIFLKLFHNEHIIKSFYICYESKTVPGTYMMDSRMLKPYMVSLIGYEGDNIEKLFSLNPSAWRDNVLFDLKPVDIYSVELIYPKQPDESFKIINQEGKNPLLFALNSDIPEVKANKDDIRDYLSYFMAVRYANIDKGYSHTRLAEPFVILKITSTQQQKYEMQAFRRSLSDGSYDMNYYYVLAAGDTLPMLVKYIETDPIMKTFSDFIKK